MGLVESPTAGLFGRDDEIAVLRGCVARVVGGEPGLVVLSGTPGVGKTRLAREALAIAEAAGFASLAGQAHPLNRDVAYAPLVQPLGIALRSMEPDRAARLTADLPQLGVLFSGLGFGAVAPLADPALERARLLDGLARLVERLARERPLALLIDDVHAADPATTAALRYLSAGVTDLPVVVVLTRRAGAANGDGVEALIGAVGATTWWVEGLDVEPLARGAAADFVTAVVGSDLDRDVVSRVVEHCGGHPLFLEAVARAIAERGLPFERDGRFPLPRDVRDQLAARVTNTTPAEWELLTLLAVAGAEVETEILVSASGSTRAETVELLGALHQRGLLQSNDGGTTFDLAHGLLRDTLLDRASSLDSARAHLRLFETLSAMYPSDGRLAEHVLGAGAFVEPGRALSHLAAGGERAQRLGATEDAVRYFTAAADLARPHERSSLTALLADLAALWAGMGRGDKATALWEEAAHEYAQAGDPLGISRCEREIAALDWSRADLESARNHLAAAASALNGLEPSPEHAELLHARTMFATRTGDTTQVRVNARALRDLSDRLGSRSQAAYAHLAEAIVNFGATDYVAMTESTRRGIDEARAADDPVLLVRAYDQASIAAATQGDTEALRRYSLESLRVGRETGALVLQLWPRARVAVADLLSGDWDAALRGTSEVLGLTRRLSAQAAMPRGLVSILATHALVLVHRGRLADAHSCLRESRKLSSSMLTADRNIYSVVDTASGMLALADGDAARAVECARQLEDLTSGWFPLLSAAILGEALARSGDTGGAYRLAGRLRAVVSCSTALPGALADWIEGLADTHLAKPEQAAAKLARAAGAFDGLSLPYHASRARLSAAQTGGDSDAVRDAKHALKVFDELGAVIPARDARVLLRSLGVVPSRGRRRQETGGPLSARELEVARLVASGLTNAEVATRLYVSPRTVTTHLDHIYTRLELSSRVALTRYLADSGLLDERPSRDR